ncbi:MAG: hypothetical protein ACJ76V_03140 [Thermoleophilaceae bacterium]
MDAPPPPLLVRVAARLRRGPNAVAPIDYEAVLLAREDLLTLAGQLAIADHVSVRGVALVRRLLTEGLSPLYAPSSPERLEAFVRRARVALSA